MLTPPLFDVDEIQDLFQLINQIDEGKVDLPYTQDALIGISFPTLDKGRDE